MPTVAPLDLDGHCIAAAFIGGVPFFAQADGTVHWLDGGHKQAQVHDGLLSAAADKPGKRLVTGGEDGKLRATATDGSVSTLGEFGRKWVACVAAGPNGAAACGIGRNAHVIMADGSQVDLAHERTVKQCRAI